MRLLILTLLACGPAAPPPATPPSNKAESRPAAHELMASIERTACFGWCPIYKLVVYRDGVVEYTGERFVKTTGKATGRIDAGQLAALDELFAKTDYLKLKDSYESYDMTDMPSVYTSYARSGTQAKVVKHYLGDEGAPKTLETIEDGIDHIVKVEQWIGTKEEREKLSGR